MALPTAGLWPARGYHTGGYRRLVLWRTDVANGSSVVTDLFGPAPAQDARTNERYADGASRPTSAVRALNALVCGAAAVHTLRAWATAGATVRGLELARGFRGRHHVWDEESPLILEPADAPAGSLTGDRVLLESGAWAAAVEQSPDLLAAAAWLSPYVRVLPVPTLTVYSWVPDTDGGPSATTVTLVARDAAGATLASAGPAASVTLTLPAATWDVLVTSTGRPVLTTAPAPA